MLLQVTGNTGRTVTRTDLCHPSPTSITLVGPQVSINETSTAFVHPWRLLTPPSFTSVVTSRMDHCHALLSGLPLNSTWSRAPAACIITLNPSTPHVTPILPERHKRHCMKPKILLLTFKSLHKLGPPHTAALLHHVSSDPPPLCSSLHLQNVQLYSPSSLELTSTV